MGLEKLREKLDEEYHAHQRLIDKLSLVFIVLSVVLFTLETMPELDRHRQIFRWGEVAVVVVFTLEYIVRLVLAPEKKRFVFSFFGIVDLLSILPFYLSFGLADFRWLRTLRVLRVFRIFKLSRYIRAVDRLKLAIYRIKEELVVFSSITTMLIYFAAVGVYHFEHEVQPEHFRSIVSSLWWAVVTLTTVGYGDVYPVTTGGRLFTGLLLILGLSIISIPSGLLASSFTDVIKEALPDHPEDRAQDEREALEVKEHH